MQLARRNVALNPRLLLDDYVQTPLTANGNPCTAWTFSKSSGTSVQVERVAAPTSLPSLFRDFVFKITVSSGYAVAADPVLYQKVDDSSHHGQTTPELTVLAAGPLGANFLYGFLASTEHYYDRAVTRGFTKAGSLLWRPYTFAPTFDDIASTLGIVPWRLPSVPPTTTLNTTNGSANVTSVADTSVFHNFDTITGTGIPAGTTIVSGGGTASMVLSANATATNTGTTVTRPDIYYLAYPNVEYVAGDSPDFPNQPEIRTKAEERMLCMSRVRPFGAGARCKVNSAGTALEVTVDAWPRMRTVPVGVDVTDTITWKKQSGSTAADKFVSTGTVNVTLGSEANGDRGTWGGRFSIAASGWVNGAGAGTVLTAGDEGYIVAPDIVGLLEAEIA